MRLTAPSNSGVMAYGLLLGALAVPMVAAQQPQPVVAIRAGTLIDGTGAAPVRNAVILIQGERITAVGANVQVPRGATVIDVALLNEKGTWLVPTLMAGEQVEKLAKEARLPPFIAQKALHIAPRVQTSFRMAVEAGVRIALGTDAGVFAHGTNGHEFTLMVRYGMRPMQAIQAGTVNAATLLGLERETGSIATGKRADIVAVRGDPLANIELLERVQFVMKDGVVFKRNGEVVGRSAAGPQ